MNVENRDRFVRIATKRVNNTIKNIRLIGNLANKSNYGYTEKDIDKIFSALQDELRACKKRFNVVPAGKSADAFTLGHSTEGDSE